MKQCNNCGKDHESVILSITITHEDGTIDSIHPSECYGLCLKCIREEFDKQLIVEQIDETTYRIL